MNLTISIRMYILRVDAVGAADIQIGNKLPEIYILTPKIAIMLTL